MLIDGRKIAREILAGVKSEVAALPYQPLFCDVLVGDDGVSASYVRIKGRSAEKIGIKFKLAKYPQAISQEILIAEIKKISQTENLRGLIVQLPLPPRIDRRAVLDAIDANLDVDCMGQTNSAKFYAGEDVFVPPTAAAIMEVLDRLLVKLSTKNILVIGQGDLVGKPVSFLLRKRGLQINIADINTKNTDELLKSADVIISATGKAGLITGDKIKPGSIIIDAGTSEMDGGIVGDVDFESVKNIAGCVSPVPGGVGPVTVAMLLSNVAKVARQKLT